MYYHNTGIGVEHHSLGTGGPEFKSRRSDRQNQILNQSLDRYSRKLVKLSKSDPIVDRSAVPPNPSGERKRIAKWYSEISGG
jgi:hypothetical protein